ncbi:MAG TPA: hypothetical protein RMH99_26615 [Sandaracinaceae bacterium LLY-WYZ-13_1]|nr:hypothetical protein [Sandaracinaceae bacterium LLY-WYZ-13_1]
MSEAAAVRWWLRSGDALAKRITPGGLLLGRSPHCDVVVRSDRASRRQALCHLGPSGPRLVVLGRGPVAVDGEAVEGEVALEEGARLELPGLSLTVEREAGTRPVLGAGAGAWVLEGPRGGLFGVAQSPYLIGGGPEDDLRVDGWAPGALCLLLEGGSLVLEASVEATVDGERWMPDRRGALARGAVLAHRGARIRVVTGGAFASGSTAALESGGPAAITAARLEFLPRGGRLHLTVRGETHAVYLSDRRCDLVAVLLQPPDPLRPGDPVDDDAVIARVWGRDKAARTNLNVLLHRVRKDLVRAGLDGGALLPRAEGGGGTRVRLAEGAVVRLD